MIKSISTYICIVLSICLCIIGILWYRDNSSKQQEIFQLNGVVSTQTAQIESLTTESAAKTTQIEGLTAESVAQAAEISDLQATVSEKTSQIDALTAQAQDQATQIETLTAQSQDQASQIETLNNIISQKDSEIAQLNASISSHTSSNVSENLSSVEDAQFTSTKRFVQRLSSLGIQYTVNNVATSTGYEEKVSLSFQNQSTAGTDFVYTANVFFSSNNDRMSIYVWELVTFDSAKLSDARIACDQLNSHYRWMKFYVDESTMTVTAQYDLLLEDSSFATDNMWNTFLIVDSVVSAVYDELALLAK